MWVEVQAAGGYWLTVEPTPGYATCPPYRSWAEVAQQALVAAGNWLLRHWLAALLAGVLLVTLVLLRRTLEEFACWLVWRARLGGSPRSVLRTTIWLFEGRLRRAGRPRPPQATFSRWFQQVAGRAASGPLETPREPLATFLRQASWAQYAEHSPAPPAAEIRALCTAIVREWSPQRLAQLRPARPPLAVLRPRLLRTLFRWNAT